MKTKFHEYLTMFRKQQDLTQAEMAEKLGISRSTYTNYENGNRTPDFEVLERISNVLGCTLDELFGRNVTKCNVLREENAGYGAAVKKTSGPKLAIGVQDFRHMREKKVYYVDKTPFIEEFLESYYQVTLITRPRRFGKTLNMSMLAEFLDCTKESEELFEGTKIASSSVWKEMNQHPVIFMSFLNVKADNAKLLSFFLMETVRQEYRRYYKMLNNSTLDEDQKREFNEVYEALSQKTVDAKVKEYFARSVAVLCETLSLYYNKKVFLLLDEYDTPFMSANAGNYYEEVRSMLTGFFSESLKGNPFLEKAVLTGIQRIAKENIFSGLNNLIVCPVQGRNYEECFGFTEEEVRNLLHYCGTEFTDELKKMYDGYRFGELEVYNPWSICCYAASKKIEPYWVNTSENSILRDALEAQGTSFGRDYETLIKTGSVETRVDFSMAYYGKMDAPSLWGLLVNAGFMTIEEEEEDGYCRMRVPNLEVWGVFKELTACHLHVDEYQIGRMLHALKRNRMEDFADEYQRILLELPSYHDLKDENSYHMMMLGMCAFLRGDYVVKSNREVGTGRSDICLYTKSGRYPNLILEFKYTKDEKEDLKKLAEDAIDQIKEKRYDTGMTGEVRYIGLAHCGKKAYVTWE